MTPSREIARAWGIVKSHGLPWIGSRLLLEAQKRIGYEARAYPARAWRAEEWRDWVDVPTKGSSPAAVLTLWREGPGAAWGRARGESAAWRAGYREILNEAARASLLAAADGILAGDFSLFFGESTRVGFPPAWQTNPVTGGTAPSAEMMHWSQVPMRGQSFGDLKFVWELSRAAWAFVLARAYAATSDERYADGFWKLWLDWIDANPPNTTVQWKCGQECSLRLIAVTFAVQVLARATATTPERFVRHLGAVAALADRVRRGGWYAELQDNNHSMSEGAGVYTVAVTSPFLASAGDWKTWGWQRLGREAERLVRTDGTFVQKSHNYHRLLLHVYLWADSMARGPGDTFSAAARERLMAATDYLQAIIDRNGGGVPNFGANDGALILPLAEAPYADFRPTAAAAHFWAHGERSELGDAAAMEMPLWLFGPDFMKGRNHPFPAASALSLDRGGIYTLRQQNSWVFMHAENFRDRPSQADQLHVDLWWRGINVARDAGTYMYYGPPQLFDWFRGSLCHNTVTVDERDQMEPGPRFLWASRAQARAVVEGATAEEPASLRASHDGYLRLPQPVRHERQVRALGGDDWLVNDHLQSMGRHRYSLHWLLPDLPFRRESDDLLVLETPLGPFYVQTAASSLDAVTIAVHRGQQGGQWGWESRRYGELCPALSLVVTATGATGHFVTLFSQRRPVQPLGDRATAS